MTHDTCREWLEKVTKSNRRKLYLFRLFFRYAKHTLAPKLHLTIEQMQYRKISKQTQNCKTHVEIWMGEPDHTWSLKKPNIRLGMNTKIETLREF
jgi:hypothetical protein